MKTIHPTLRSLQTGHVSTASDKQLFTALSPFTSVFQAHTRFHCAKLKFIFQVILCSCYSDPNEGLPPLQLNLWTAMKIYMLKDHITQVHLVLL